MMQRYYFEIIKTGGSPVWKEVLGKYKICSQERMTWSMNSRFDIRLFWQQKKPSNNNSKLRLNNDSQRSIKQLNVSFRSFRPKFGKSLQLRRDTQRSSQTQSHKMLNRACILSLNPSEAMSPVPQVRVAGVPGDANHVIQLISPSRHSRFGWVPIYKYYRRAEVIHMSSGRPACKIWSNDSDARLHFRWGRDTQLVALNEEGGYCTRLPSSCYPLFYGWVTHRGQPLN
jgi:hypothetical protein